MLQDYHELTDIFNNNVNSLYLRVGGYQEIANMCYWEFVSILKTASDNNKRQSGKPVIKEGLYKSQKDMIARTKELGK